MEFAFGICFLFAVVRADFVVLNEFVNDRLRFIDTSKSAYQLCRVEMQYPEDASDCKHMTENMTAAFNIRREQMRNGEGDYKLYDSAKYIEEHHLTENDLKGIFRWSYSDERYYNSMSAFLTNYGQTGSYECSVKFLIDGLNKLDSANTEELWRGESYNFTFFERNREIYENFTNLREGQVVVTSSFTSSASRRGPALLYYGNVTESDTVKKLMFRIQKSTNSGCRYIAPVSAYPKEDECLYEPGVQFKVTQAVHDEVIDGEIVHIIELEQITRIYEEYYYFSGNCSAAGRLAITFVLFLAALLHLF